LKEDAPVRTSTAAFAAALTIIAPATAVAADLEPAEDAPASPSVRTELTGRASVGTQLERAAQRIARHQHLVRRHVKLTRELAKLEHKPAPRGVAARVRTLPLPTLAHRNAVLARRVERKRAAAESGGAGGQLAAIRACESGGDYTTNTGNGFYGAYQFDAQTWHSLGGSGLPSDASPGEQDRRAQALIDRSGASPWPVCGA
jgi:Transglycosylase-like domain